MHVLLIGSDNPVGNALQGAFSQWGRHHATTLTAAASRWRSERQAKKVVRKGAPDVIVDLRLAWTVASGAVPGPDDIDRTHWLAKASERSGMCYVLLSSDCVFSGQGSRSLRESDAPDARREPGLQLMDAEERVMAASESAIVLRTGPLFAAFDQNMLTSLLAGLGHSSPGVFDDRDVFCPVASIDIARVLAAMLDQLGVGADARGVFHYCSGDRATAYGFAEAVLAAAGQYHDLGEAAITAAEHPLANTLQDVSEHAESVRPATRVLDCSRLRDSFAIKQVPWRGFINPLVKQFYQVLEEDTRTEPS